MVFERAARNNEFPEDELNMYTWMDATLKELSMLVAAGNEAACRKGTRFSFSGIYRDRWFIHSAIWVNEIELKLSQRGIFFFTPIRISKEWNGGKLNLLNLTLLQLISLSFQTRDDSIQLRDTRFQIGDYLSVALFPPRQVANHTNVGH